MKNLSGDLSGESRFLPLRSGLRTARNRGMWRQHRGPLLKRREKGGAPLICFTSTFQKTRVTLPALIGPTRPFKNDGKHGGAH